MKRNHYVFMICCLIIVLLIRNSASSLAAGPEKNMNRYNVVWNSPSKDATGVMPVGNGDIAAGVYAIENGDLYLLLAKNDAYTYMGDIFKTGRVRVSLKPNPFTAGKPFRQTLDLATGSIRIEADGMNLLIWADANRPVYHVEINSPKEIAVIVQPDLWKRIDHTVFNVTKLYTSIIIGQPDSASTQDVLLEKGNKMLWYFHVGDRSTYPDDLKFYNVGQMSSKFADPFKFNTFGNLLESPQLSLTGGSLTGKGKSFDIRIHALTMQTPDPSRWIEEIGRQAARPSDLKKEWNDHRSWWTNFWDRSWIIATDNTLPAAEREKLNGEPTASGTREEKDGAALTAQSYNVFRFLMACQSRGHVQVKFNGGLFTQQLKLKENDKKMRSGMLQQPDGLWLTNEDDRLWGRRFTFQNQRLLYWPLLASGDFDLMKPFFDYYSNLLEMRKAITKAWFGHDGAYYRENIEPTGAEQDCDHGGKPPKTKPGEKYEGWYHDYYFTSGLETLAMMIDNVNYKGDKAFRDNVLVPFAREILLFFDKHYLRGADGKIRLEPAQVLETWWIAVNPAPDVAGLRFCVDELLAMKAGTTEDQVRWRKFRGEIPEVFLQTIGGRKAIAPAEKWEKKQNAENGELYPVFPFRCFGIGPGTGDIVDWTMKNRSLKDAFGSACWTQDQIHWAYAGNATEASKGLVRRFRIASPMCRFPLFGREGPDSCPDFDHFGAGSTALQRMLIQEVPGKILLLPAWPKEWDVNFKLHAMQNTTIEGSVKDGKLISFKVTPESRRKDVDLAKGWSLIK
jgi:alpha-L-fucosidase 2